MKYSDLKAIPEATEKIDDIQNRLEALDQDLAKEIYDILSKMNHLLEYSYVLTEIGEDLAPETNKNNTNKNLS